MQALVVYESMYGNTHTVAERIGEGLSSGGWEVEVVPVEQAATARLAKADLVVVGGPTHIHGMSTKLSRGQAVAEQTLQAEAAKGHELEVDPDAEGEGLRDWFDGLDLVRPVLAAAFDTRFGASPLLTGRASKGINRKLVHHGCEVVVPPESFVVDKDTHLVDGEEERAAAWGRALLEGVVAKAKGLHWPEVAAAEPDPAAHLDDVLESGGRYAPPR